MASTYSDLTSGLPERLYLDGLPEIVRDVEDPELALDEERASVRALVDALRSAGLDMRDTDAATAISLDSWQEYWRELEFGSVTLKDPAVLDYVDWDDYLTTKEADFERMTVTSGEFAGDWWVPLA